MYTLPPAILSSIASSSSVPLTVREALSGVFGSISLASWIFVLLPQLVENYRNQSAEAVSLVFLGVWLVGDITNLLGGLWAELVPTVIAIAIYFCFLDVVLIGQCLYYGIKSRRKEGKTWLEATRGSVSGALGVDANGHVEGSGINGNEALSRQQPQQQQDDEEYDEEQPLLKRTTSVTGAVMSQRSGGASDQLHSQNSTNSVQRRRSSAAIVDDHLVKILKERDSKTGSILWLKNVIGVIGVILLGCLGWFVAYKVGLWKPAPLQSDKSDEPIAKGAQILGYISAIAYLGARIPQIIKNWKEQSCEGLSLLFFILSLMGNLAYGASILSHSTQRDYVIKNVPWLVGSLGTMVEDITIFVQFHLYRDQEPGQSAVVID